MEEFESAIDWWEAVEESDGQLLNVQDDEDEVDMPADEWDALCIDRPMGWG